MTPEEAKSIKCDRCGVTVGLHRHEHGWRCPTCIWNELAEINKTVYAMISTPHDSIDRENNTIVVDLDDYLNLEDVYDHYHPERLSGN